MCEGEEQYDKQICKNNLAIKYATIEAHYNICFLEVSGLLFMTIDVKLELEHSVYLLHSLLLSIQSVLCEGENEGKTILTFLNWALLTREKSIIP